MPLSEIRARIAAAEARAGRAPGSVRLIAVSKVQPLIGWRRCWSGPQAVRREPGSGGGGQVGRFPGDLRGSPYPYRALQTNKALR